MDLSTMLVRISAFILAFAVAGFPWQQGASAARGDQWSLAVELPLDRPEGQETLDLRKLTGSFMAFRLRVVGGRVKFSELTLSYSDGSSYAVDRTFQLSDGERTKILDLNRGGRFIDFINISYAVTSQSGKPKLEIHALQSWRGRRAKRAAEVVHVAANAPPPLPMSVAEVLPEATGGILLGTAEIAPAPEAAKLDVREQVGKFERVRLQVRKRDVYVDRLHLTYDDGTTAVHEVDLHLPEGRTTGWLGTDGSRFIVSAEISVQAKLGESERAQIDLFGEPSEDWFREEGANYNDGWLLLGARHAGFVGFDSSVVPVGEHISGFSKVRVVVLERAITLDQIRVVYGNGDKDIIPVRTRIDAGSAFGPVGLREPPRRIREIQARYRSRFIDRQALRKGPAIVEVWAKR